MTFSIGEKLELRKHVSTIDKISLLVRQHYYAKITKVTICFKGSSHVSTKQKNKAQRVAPRPPSRAFILDHITWHLWSTGRSNKNTAIQIAKNETHRIHSCMYGIYANIGGILMGSMLPYIAAPWIRHGKLIAKIIRAFQKRDMLKSHVCSKHHWTMIRQNPEHD